MDLPDEPPNGTSFQRKAITNELFARFTNY